MTTLTPSTKSLYGVKPWPKDLPPPIDPLDSVLISRAQSILISLVGSVSISASQAQDVIAWAKTQH